MKTKKSNLKIYLFLICFLLIAAVFAGQYSAADFSLTKNDKLNFNIKTTVTEPDGRKTDVFCSGDQYFNYMHDDKGNLLLLNDYGYLVYAKNDGTGRPVPSELSASREATAVDRLFNNTKKMKYGDINFENNPDLLTEYTVENEKDTIDLPKAQGANPTTVNNYIIYICFNDDTKESAVTACSGIEDFCNQDGNSLKSYYYDVTAGFLTVNSMAPKSGSQVVVYQDSHIKKYFEPYHYLRNPIGYNGDSQRGAREAVLLTAAVNYANDYFSGNSDVNGDGKVDSVSFIFYGSYNSTSWNTLLWPHAWALDDINYYYNNNASATIAGADVGDYTVNFSSALTTGVLCHEFGHVLGAPDLYHYYKKDYVPVGEWDLMSMDQDTPQYMTTYMRDKYLGYVGENQISTVTQTGVYSLAPLTSTDAFSTGVYAYKIPGRNSSEYFMVEYRTSEGTEVYEDELPGNGLIVYRINTTVNTGNRDAEHKNTSAPDEIFIFRPSLPSSMYYGYTDTYNKSLIESWYAGLSSENEYFKSVGAPLTAPVTDYSNGSIYYTDGTNSGITITALSLSPENMQFYVSLPNNNSGYSDILNKLYIDGVTHFDGETSVSVFADTSLDFSLFTSAKLKIYDNALNVVGEKEIRNELIENFYKGQNSSFNFKLTNIPYKAELIVTTATGATLKKEFSNIVEDIITGISVSDYKTEYAYGEELDKSTGTVTLTTEEGKIRTVPLSYPNLVFSAFDNTSFISQTVTVSYNALSANMTVSVVDEPVSISVSGTKCYISGDELKLNVAVLWEKGATSSVNLSECNVTSGGVIFTTADKTVGEYILAVTATISGSTTAKNLSANYTVNICNPATSLEIFKGEALMNAESTTVFDSVPLNLKALADENDVTNVADITYNPLLVDANQTLTVKYLGLIETRTIYINDYVTGVSYEGASTVNFGSNLSGTLKISYAGGTTDTIDVTNQEVTLSGFNNTVLGEQILTLAYGGKSTEITVTIKDYVLNAEIIGFDTEYLIGESLANGYVLNYTTASGVSGTVNLLNSNFLGFSTDTAGEKTISVSYNVINCGECVYPVNITVLDPVVRLEPAGNIKIYDVVYAENFNLSIYAVYKSGATKLLNKTDYSIEGFDKFKKGEQLVGISYIWNASYPSVTLEVEVYVHDSVVSLKLDTVTNNAKVSYPYGEALDLKGVILKAVTSSGEEILLIDSEGTLRDNVNMSVFDPTYIGAQKISFIYENLTVYYYITVRPKTSAFISSESLEIDKSKRYIFADISTSFETLATKISFESAEMKLDGTAGTLKTGDSVNVINGAGQIVDIFTVIVIGDLTGDGKITENDLEILADFLTGKSKTNTAVIAADIDRNGTVGINDYMLMRKYMLEAAK